MGIRHGDLEGMILPLISIDEFEPKSGTDEEIIVVAFFARDELPAYDLDEFIDKSIVKILDSETAPNPNEDGYWLVFVEFKRQPNFWLHFYDLVKDVENATGKMNWEVQAYKEEKLYALKDAELRQVIPTTEEDYMEKRMAGAAEEYFEESALLGFTLNGRSVMFEGARGRLAFTLVDFGGYDAVYKRQNLAEAKLNYMATSPRATALKQLLGEGWDVTLLGDYILVSNTDEKYIGVLK